VFATNVGSFAQERDAELLVTSIRRFGGEYANVPIFVTVEDLGATPCRGLQALGATVLALEGDAAGRRYLFGQKVYAAAQVERLVETTAHTLVWFDPETIVLGPPADLDLGGTRAAALRPVYLTNKVALTPDQPADAFWKPILDLTGLTVESLPVVDSVVHREKMRAYFNCGIIAYRPSVGICREWARLFTLLVNDSAFQKAACGDAPHRIFLHQAVVSAVIVARTKPSDWRWLPEKCGYPLNLHDQMPQERKAARLNDLTCAVVEDVWDSRPDLQAYIRVDEPLASWLDEQLTARLRVVDRLYREERSCNSYLVTTPAGTVIIDPAGASDPPGRLLAMARKSPVQAILLTHGHDDHRKGIPLWRGERSVPVVAQRELVEFLSYQDRLAPFLERRFAAQNGLTPKAPAAAATATPVEATVLFTDRHSLTVGDLHFELIHTGGETPDTSLIWVPELSAAFIGDNFYTSFPNLATLRGTKPRWALDYVEALDTALALGPEALLPGHGEPVLGRERVARVLREYRDAIVHVHDATVKGMNEGKDVFTLMREITLPPGSDVGESFGRVSWAVRGIYEGYAGWFDEKPTTMYPVAPSAIFPEIATLAGGADRLAARARELAAAGDHVSVLQLTEIALASEPGHRGALTVRLDALRALRAASRNYIERNWLDYAIRQAEAARAEPAR
jgi:glyoxylase-like metal-dependent hydrolase (beta-lactamase superfamily II)